MPDLNIVAKLIDGGKTVEGLDALEKKYSAVGESGSKSFKEAERSAGLFGRSMGTVRQLAGGLALAFGGLTIAAQIGHWVSAAVDFEEEWMKVMTLLDGSPQHFAGLKKELEGLGVDFGTSSERARGLFTVIKTGIEESKAVKFLETSMRLAQTVFIDTDSAVKLLNVSLKAYGKETSEAGRMSEVLFKIMRSGGGVAAGELQSALARIAPVAAGMGVELSDIGAIMATLKQQGIPAGQAVQVLMTIMMRMTMEGSRLNKALKDMGIDMSTARIKSEGFGAVMGDMADVIKGDAELVQELGIPVRQLGAFLALTGKSAEEYKKKMEEMRAETNKQNEAWEEVNSTLKDKWGDTIVAVEKKVVQFMDKLGDHGLKGFLDGVVQTLETGVMPLNAFTVALYAFAAAIAAVKLADFWGWLVRIHAQMKLLAVMEVVGSFKEWRLGLKAVGEAAGLTVGKLGALKTAGVLAAAALVGWGLGRLISDLFGLDDALGKVWMKLGLFQGRVREMNDQATASMQKAADALQSKYGVQLEKVGISVQRNGKSLAEWGEVLGKASQAVMVHVKAMEKSNEVQDKKIKLTAEEKKKIEEWTKEIEKAASPLKELTEKIELLSKGGKFNRQAFAEAYSKEILDLINLYEQLGRAIPKSVVALREMATAVEDGRAAAAQAQDVEKRWVDGLEAEAFLWPKLTSKLKDYNMEGMIPMLRTLHDNYAQMLLDKQLVRDKAEAQVEANKKVEELTQAFIKNREELKKLDETFKDSIPPSEALAESWRLLGLAMPLGTYRQVEEELKKVSEAMSTLGLKNVEYDIEQAEKAFKVYARRVGVTEAQVNEARLALFRKYMDSGKQLGILYAQQLEEMAFSADKALRERALPAWKEYAEKARDINGKFSKDVVDQLYGVMVGTDKMLKGELLTLWQEYIDTCRDKYGKLPPALDEVNRKIVRDAELAAGRVGQQWLQEISTVMNDLVKGIVDRIVDGTAKATDILKDWGKSIMRMLLNDVLSPLMKGFQNLMSGKGWGEGQEGAGGGLGGVIGAVAGLFKGKSKGTEGIDLDEALKNLPGGGSAGGGWLSKALPSKGEGGSGQSGVGGVVGSFMQGIGTMMALDSLKRKGLAGGLEGGIGGAAAGYAMGGWQGAGIGAGGTLFAQGLMEDRASGWGKAIGGGALAGFSIAGPLGAAIGSLGGAVTKLVQFLHRSVSEKAVREAARDFGGMQFDDKEFKQFITDLGLTEKAIEGVRKEVLMSPQLLVKFLGPLAEAQGRNEDFLRSLEQVRTAWGDFNFRDAYELGSVTGDWEALDEAFKKAMEEGSKIGEVIPDWAQKLTISGEAAQRLGASFQEMYKGFKDTLEVSDELEQFLEENAEALDELAKKSKLFADELARVRSAIEFKPLISGFNMLKDALNSFNPVAYDMYQTFMDTGVILPELEEQIVKYGGDLQKFKDVSQITGIVNEFKALTAHFKETGEILPRLSDLFEQFGGDLEVLGDASKIQGLQGTINSIDELRKGLMEMLPELSPIQEILAGNWSEEIAAGLEAMGIDPEKLRGMAEMVKLEREWADLVEGFQKDPHLGAGMQSALAKFGGEEGLLALERYKKGFAAVSPELLAKVKKNMDAAFKEERNTVFGYLDEIQAKTQMEVDDLSAKIENQFAIVSDNIAKVFEVARKVALIEIETIMQALMDAVRAAADLAGTLNPPAVVPPGGGDGGESDDREDGKDTIPDVALSISFDGATIYGMNDFKNQVGQAVTQIWKDGGLQVLRQRVQ